MSSTQEMWERWKQEREAADSAMVDTLALAETLARALTEGAVEPAWTPAERATFLRWDPFRLGETP